MIDTLITVCLGFVLLGMVPTLATFAQFLLVGLHGRWNHYPKCADHTPRVAFILPAWNEADVLGASIDSLMGIDYPAGAWRLYIVDDASTDNTPEVMRGKMAQYPGSVFHLRREKGGQGKAHTLNHGIHEILADDWAEAIMIMDADVLFERTTLRRMARHFADPEVGGVTAYVKEGSEPASLLSRFIAFEYVTAQAAARRAQNVAGGIPCMAGGAQLHSRENLLAIGGRIDTSTLAEDTYTTIKTQICGRRALFDPNAIVWAEPDLLIVSPFLRAEATAEPIRARWPAAPCETWPIQELTYLSPARCRGTTADTRRPWAEEYWRRCDPDYCDGPDAESFRTFMGRLGDFHRRLLTLDGGFVIAVGHGQFFRAYLMALEEGFAATADWMKGYRSSETARPMANGEVIELDGAALARAQGIAG